MTERKTIAELVRELEQALNDNRNMALDEWTSMARAFNPAVGNGVLAWLTAAAVAELLRREGEREAEKRQRHLAAFERFVTDPNNARAMQQLAKTEAKGPPFLCKDCNWPIPICHCGTGNLRSAEAREHLARKRAKEPDE